ncbi:hypothetical protein ACMFMG_009800 [Clarireedia jacksonii]
MCIWEYLAHKCGHCSPPILIECPLTASNSNFPRCEFVAERPIDSKGYCHACARIVWNRQVLEDEEVHRQQHENGECQCEVVFTQEERERREKEYEEAFETWYQENGHNQVSMGVIRPTPTAAAAKNPGTGQGSGLMSPIQMPMMSLFPSTHQSAIGWNQVPINHSMAVGNGGFENGSYLNGPPQYCPPPPQYGWIQYGMNQYGINQYGINQYGINQYGTNQCHQNQDYPSDGSYSAPSTASNEKYAQAYASTAGNHHPSIDKKAKYAESHQYTDHGVDYQRSHRIVNPFQQVGSSGAPAVPPRRGAAIGGGMSWYPGKVISPPPLQPSSLRRTQTRPAQQSDSKAPKNSMEPTWKDTESTADQVQEKLQLHSDVSVSSKDQKVGTPVVGGSVAE